MRRNTLLAAAAMVLLGTAFGACSEKDDPESLTIDMTAINPATDGITHHMGDAVWREAGAIRLLGASPFVFSVSDSGKVRFSPGNLQYNPSNGRWQFASRQFLTAETDPDAEPGLTDLFGWGTSGWESGAAATMPTDIDEADSHYWVGSDVGGGLYADWAEADWAVHNPIANGGNRAHLWRVLRASEWQYLFGTSPQRRNKWGLATIDGTYPGVVVLPDNWTLPGGLGFTPGADGWNTNEYNAVQWFDMEQAGAVFLPASGYRDGERIVCVGLTGNYWTSDAVDSCCARDLFFRSLMLDARDLDARHYGFSVRPVLE